MFEEPLSEQLILVNKETKQQLKFSVDPNFYTSADQLIVSIGGETYKLVTTKTQEQLKLEKAIVNFGSIEFPKLSKRYPDYGSSSAHLKLPPTLKDDISRILDKPAYKVIRRHIHKDEDILTRLVQSFAQYTAVTKTVEVLNKEAEGRRLDDVYLIDYAKRYLAIMDRFVDTATPPTKGEISKMFESINADLDIDKRRPIGSAKVLSLLSPFMGVISKNAELINKLDKEVKYYDPAMVDYQELWNSLLEVSKTTKTGIEDWLVSADQRRQTYAEMTEEKFHYHATKAVKLHKSILEKYNNSIKLSEEDPDKLHELQQQFIQDLNVYINDIENYGCEVMYDRRTIEDKLQKALELQYDVVFYFYERRQNDPNWIAKMLHEVSQHIPFLLRAIEGKPFFDQGQPSTKE